MAKKRKKGGAARRRRRRSNPRVRAHMARAPHSRRKHRVRGFRRRRNPRRGGGVMGHVMEGAKAAAFGGLAALIGLGVGFAILKMGLSSKLSLVGANAGAGLLAGTALGMVDPIGGRIVAHNFAVSAGQYLAAPSIPTQQVATPFEPTAAGQQVQGLVGWDQDQFGNIIDRSDRALGFGNLSDYAGSQVSEYAGS